MRETNTIIAIDPDVVEQLQAAAPSDERLVAMLETLQALADTTRLKILYALTQHEVCVRDLALLVGVSESAISHQLRLLKNRHLVQQRRDGNIIYYSLNDHHLPELMREIEHHVEHVQQELPDHHRST